MELVAVQSVMKTVIFTSVAWKRKVSILVVIALRVALFKANSVLLQSNLVNPFSYNREFEKTEGYRNIKMGERAARSLEQRKES